MISYKYELVLINNWQPIEIDKNYFDKLVKFGLACLIAGMVGQIVISLLNRSDNKLGVT